MNENAEVRFYPNPTNDNLTIEYKIINGESNSMLRVYDVLGKEVMKKEMTGETGIVNLSLARLENGIYHIVIISGEEVITTQKIVVQK